MCRHNYTSYVYLFICLVFLCMSSYLIKFHLRGYIGHVPIF